VKTPQKGGFVGHLDFEGASQPFLDVSSRPVFHPLDLWRALARNLDRQELMKSCQLYLIQAIAALALILPAPAFAQVFDNSGSVQDDQSEEYETYNGFTVKKYPVEIQNWEQFWSEFQRYTPQQQAKFMHVRQWLLTKVSVLLRSGRGVIGGTLRLKEKSKKIAQGIKEGLSDEIIRLDLNAPDVPLTNETPAPVTLRELGQPVAQAVMNALNGIIWAKHPVFTHSNEAGVSLMLSTGFGVGFKTTGLFGPIGRKLKGRPLYKVLGLNFNLGYNYADKEVYLEMTFDHESITHITTYVAEAYVGFKPTPFVQSLDPSKVLDPRRGEGHYGGPIGSLIESPEYLAAGITYCVGYPTFPYSGVAIFDTAWNRIPIFRLTLKPRPSYIKFQDIFSKKLLNYAKVSFEKIKGLKKARACGDALNELDEG